MSVVPVCFCQVIALVDEEGTGTLDFNSFFRIVCLYCYFSEEDILNFCFQTFDKDASGQIDEEEFLDLARTVNNAEPLFPGSFDLVQVILAGTLHRRCVLTTLAVLLALCLLV